MKLLAILICIFVGSVSHADQSFQCIAVGGPYHSAQASVVVSPAANGKLKVDVLYMRAEIPNGIKAHLVGTLDQATSRLYAEGYINQTFFNISLQMGPSQSGDIILSASSPDKRIDPGFGAWFSCK